MLSHFRARFRNVAFGAAWAAGVVFGVSTLWNYSSRAGVSADAPSKWPQASRVSFEQKMPTLLVLVHPHCPCSRATIGELARLMARCEGKLRATVLMVRPTGAPEGWEKTELWGSAAAIPGVTVIADESGKESERFGAATSGQALFYTADGRLLFSGGITESRGHSGDNAGESAIESLVLDANGDPSGAVAHTPVYGCPLFDKAEVCTKEGGKACRP